MLLRPQCCELGNFGIGNLGIGDSEFGNWEFGNLGIGNSEFGIWGFGNSKLGIRNLGIWELGNWGFNTTALLHPQKATPRPIASRGRKSPQDEYQTHLAYSFQSFYHTKKEANKKSQSLYMAPTLIQKRTK